MMEPVSHVDYNKRLQDMQDFCIAAGLEHRVRADGDLRASHFDVYWDGRWRNVGFELRPMTPDRICAYSDVEDARIRYQAVGSI